MHKFNKNITNLFASLHRMFSKMNQITSVSVLGGGWLGLPLALSLKKKSLLVKISTTTDNKLEIFRQEGLEPHKIILDQNSQDMGTFLKTDVLIICFPPKIKSQSLEYFYNQIEILCRAIANEKIIQKIIFVSSTSIYTSNEGLKTENDADPTHYLFKAEKLLKENLPDKTILIVRMAGLMGYDRNPCKYFGIRDFNPQSRVNYIHRDDAVEVLDWLALNFAENITVNLCAPLHPSRGQITEVVCKQNYGNFNEDLAEGEGKIVDSTLFESIFQKKLKYPDPLNFKYL